jgi:hypothetical protein
MESYNGHHFFLALALYLEGTVGCTVMARRPDGLRHISFHRRLHCESATPMMMMHDDQQSTMIRRMMEKEPIFQSDRREAK